MRDESRKEGSSVRWERTLASFRRNGPALLLVLATILATAGLYWKLLVHLRADPLGSVMSLQVAISSVWQRIDQVEATSRFILTILAIAAAVTYAIWRSRRTNSEFLGDDKEFEFRLTTLDELETIMLEEISQMRRADLLNDVSSLRRLLEQVVVGQWRSVVKEVVEVDQQTLRRRVIASFPAVKKNEFLLVSAPRKNRRFRDFKILSSDVRGCTFIESLAVLTLLWTGLFESAFDKAPDSLHEALECVVGDDAAKSRCIQTIQHAKPQPTIPAVASHRLLVALMRVMASRRVLLAVSQDEIESIEFSYSEPILLPAQGQAIPTTRRLYLARRIRAAAGANPKVVSVPIHRALTAERYSIELSVPPGTYIHQAGLWDFVRRTWYKNLDREVFYTAFTGHLVHADLSRVRAAVSSFSARARRQIISPRLAVSFGEVPPGSMAAGALLSLATFAVVWTYGAFYPEGNSQYIDLASFGLALPGLLATIFAVRSVGAPYASVSAWIHAVVSVLVCFAGILLMMVYQQWPEIMVGTDLITDVMQITKGPWLLLVSVALLNATWASLDLVRSMFQYRTVRAGASTKGRLE